MSAVGAKANQTSAKQPPLSFREPGSGTTAHIGTEGSVATKVPSSQ